MLVAGNDRVQTIITQLEDSCRVTKVRGKRALVWGSKASGCSQVSGVKAHLWVVATGWGLEAGVFNWERWSGDQLIHSSTHSPNASGTQLCVRPCQRRWGWGGDQDRPDP